MRMNLKSVVPAFLVTALALISQGCGGPTLERWHNENLTEEFPEVANRLKAKWRAWAKDSNVIPFPEQRNME